MRYVRFHELRHPVEMGEAEVEAFLTDLAVRGRVAPSTQNQALNALVYLYKHVLERPLGDISALRARPRDRLPVVLTVAEVTGILHAIPAGECAVQARLLFGCGLRLMECLRLRVKDLDLGGMGVTVRGGKGDKNRAVTLPESLKGDLRQQIAYARSLYDADAANGAGG